MLIPTIIMAVLAIALTIIAYTFFFPPIAGLIANKLFSGVSIALVR